MSDSETADIPTDTTIVRAIRDVVISIYKSGRTDDLTVRTVRERAEEELGLSGGFLKNEAWKQKSKDVIKEAVSNYGEDEPEPEPVPSKKATKQKPAIPKKQTGKETTRGVKRKAPVVAKKTQKRRKAASSDEQSEPELSDVPDEVSDAGSEPPKKPARWNKKVVEEESEEDGKDKDSSVERKQAPPPAPAPKGDMSESEMSSLIDESPVKKKRQKSSEKPSKEKKAKAAKAPKATKAKTTTKADDDPDQAEIKRLQGWLVKCGIRKLWGKELASFDTPREKIRHLKSMLSDAGMEGKYSVEKAAQIKEKREFAKDLEAIQAGAASWGKQETTATGRPRRAANKPISKPSLPKFSDSEDDDGIQEDDDDPTDDEDADIDDEVKADSEESEADGDGGDDSE